MVLITDTGPIFCVRAPCLRDGTTTDGGTPVGNEGTTPHGKPIVCPKGQVIAHVYATDFCRPMTTKERMKGVARGPACSMPGYHIEHKTGFDFPPYSRNVCVKDSSSSSSTKIPKTVELKKGTLISKISIMPGASAKGNPNFNPKTILVTKNAGIIWTNNDNVPHTITSSKDQGKTFDSSIIMPKKTFTLDVSKLSPNAYDYFFRTIHPFMKLSLLLNPE